MDSSLVILEWDSERFGYPVAKVASGTSPAELKALAVELRRCGVRLAYWSTEAELSPSDHDLLCGVGGKLVDCKRTYVARARANAKHLGHTVSSYDAREADGRLIQLARAAGVWSRFRVDERIASNVFEAIYDAWIIRSARREIAADVLVTVDSRGVVVGLVTVGGRNGRADIGLLSVDESARGKGVGKALVQAAKSWGADRGFDEIQVVTQGHNRPACALYEACDFTLERTEYVYHLWAPFGASDQP